MRHVIFLTVAISFFGRTSVVHADVNEAFLTSFPAPNAKVIKAAVSGLEKYRDTRPYKTEWKIDADEQKGTIETNWFPEHKGEVKLKVQIVVWGNSFRVDVWQKVGWIWSSVEKTETSRKVERHIQDSIAAKLTTGKS